MNNICAIFFSICIFFSISAAHAYEPPVSLKAGDRIEFTRFEGKRTRGTVTQVSPNGLSLSVLQDDGERFSFVISEAYAARYQVELLSGQAGQSNPEHQSVASRPPTICPDLSPKQGQTPNKALLRTLVTCWFEDTTKGGIYAGKTINVDILDFKVGKTFKRGNTLAYHDPNAPITPVKVKFNQRIYNSRDVTVTKGAVYNFTVYVDYHDRWAVNPEIINLGSTSNVPLAYE